MQIKLQDTALHLSAWLSSRGQERTVVDKVAEKRELLCLVGGNVNGAAMMDRSMETPKKIKSRTTM